MKLTSLLPLVGKLERVCGVLGCLDQSYLMPNVVRLGHTFTPLRCLLLWVSKCSLFCYKCECGKPETNKDPNICVSMRIITPRRSQSFKCKHKSNKTIEIWIFNFLIIKIMFKNKTNSNSLIGIQT